MTTEREKAVWSSAVGGISAFVAWVSNVPPEMQEGLISSLTCFMPSGWRTGFGMCARIFASLCMVYAVYHATKVKDR